MVTEAEQALIESRQKQKQTDLLELTKLYEQLKIFAKTYQPDKDVPGEAAVKKMLLTLANQCSLIAWNEKFKCCIRNRYGKINYENGRKNTLYFDFERFSYLSHILDSVYADNFLAFIRSHITLLREEFACLSQNILFIINAELADASTDGPGYFTVNQQDMLADLSTAKTTAELKISDRLNAIIDIYHDPIVLDKIIALDVSAALAVKDANSEYIFERYTRARVLTIYGEAVKRLSEQFIACHLDLPLYELKKIRDALAHGYQRYFFVYFKQFTSEQRQELDQSLLKLQEEVITIREQFSLPNESDEVEPNGIYRTSIAEACHDIENLKLKMEKLQKERNKTTQVKSSGKSEDAHAKKLARLQSARNELMIHQQTRELTKKESQILAQIEKGLKKLAVPKSSSSAKKIALRSAEEVEAEIKETEAKILEKQKINFFSSLHHMLKTTVISDTREDAEDDDRAQVKNNKKITRLLRNILEETNRLKECYKQQNTKIARDFSLEHSIAILGQLMKDFKESGEKLADEMLAKNRAMASSLHETIQTRHKRVMHAPLETHTAAINLTIEEHALPVESQLLAVQRIDDSYIEGLLKNSNKIIIETSVRLGGSYLQLGLFADALMYFKQAYRFTSTSAFAYDMGVTLEPDAVDVGKYHDFGLPIGLTEMYCAGNIHFIGEIPFNILEAKLLCLEKMIYCHLELKNYEEAKTHAETVLQIVEQYPGLESAFEISYAINMAITAYAQINLFAEAMDLSKKYQILIESNPNLSIDVRCNLASSAQRLGKNDVGLLLLDDIKENEIERIDLKLKFCSTKAALFAGLCSELEVGDVYSNPKFEENFVALDRINEAKQWSTETLTLLEEHSAQLKTEQFQQYDGYLQLYHSCHQKILGNYAASLGNCATYLQQSQPIQAHTYMKEAISIQRELGGVKPQSWQTLGSIYEKLAENSPIQNKQAEYLKKAIAAYQHNRNTSDLHRRAIALAGIGMMEIKLKNHAAGLSALIDAKWCYSKIDLPSLDERDEREKNYIEERINDCRRNIPLDELNKRAKTLENLVNETQSVEWCEKWIIVLEIKAQKDKSNKKAKKKILQKARLKLQELKELQRQQTMPVVETVIEQTFLPPPTTEQVQVVPSAAAHDATGSCENRR